MAAITPRTRIAHLLRRAGFGASDAELDEYAALGFEASVERRLHPEEVPDDLDTQLAALNLDLDTAAALHTALEQALDRPAPRVVVDLSGLQFCDSTGLSAFVVGGKRAAGQGGWLRLAAPSDWMRGLFDTLGLTHRLVVYPDVAAALAAPAT